MQYKFFFMRLIETKIVCVVDEQNFEFEEVLCSKKN